MKRKYLQQLIILGLVLLLGLSSACSRKTVVGAVDYQASLALLSYETVADGLVGVVYRRIENLPALLAASEAPVLLAFYDSADQINVLFIPVLEQMAVDHLGQLQLILVDAGRETEIAGNFTVGQLPQFTIVQGAAIKKSLVGFSDQGLVLLEELIRPYLS